MFRPARSVREGNAHLFNWIQPIAIGSRPCDVDRTNRDPVASGGWIAIGSRSDRDPVASVDRPLARGCQDSTTIVQRQSLAIRSQTYGICFAYLHLYGKSAHLATTENQ